MFWLYGLCTSFIKNDVDILSLLTDKSYAFIPSRFRPLSFYLMLIGVFGKDVRIVWLMMLGLSGSKRVVYIF